MEKIMNKIKELYSKVRQKLGGIFSCMTPSQPEFNLDEDHFQSASDELVGFMWEQGVETLKSLERSYRINKENSAKLLNLLLAGAGGSAVLLIKDAQIGHFYFGLVILVFGWACCSIYLVKECIEAKKRFLMTASPEDIYVNDNVDPSKKMALQKIKRYVLYNMSETIYEMDWLVMLTAKNLDKVRTWAAYVAVAATVVSVLHHLFI